MMLNSTTTTTTTTTTTSNARTAKDSNRVHQRKPSLTTICPPTDKRIEKRRNSTQHFSLRTTYSKKSWLSHIMDMPAIQLVGWAYVVICFCLSTIHLISSFSILDPNKSKTITVLFK